MEADVRRVRVLWPLDLDPAAAIDALGDPAALRGWRLRREGSVVWVVVCSADRHDDDADDQDHLEIVGEISSSRNSSRRLFEYRLDLGDGAGPRAVAREAFQLICYERARIQPALRPTTSRLYPAAHRSRDPTKRAHAHQPLLQDCFALLNRTCLHRPIGARRDPAALRRLRALERSSGGSKPSRCSIVALRRDHARRAASRGGRVCDRTLGVLAASALAVLAWHRAGTSPTTLGDAATHLATRFPALARAALAELEAGAPGGLKLHAELCGAFAFAARAALDAGGWLRASMVAPHARTWLAGALGAACAWGGISGGLWWVGVCLRIACLDFWILHWLHAALYRVHVLCIREMWLLLRGRWQEGMGETGGVGAGAETERVVSAGIEAKPVAIEHVIVAVLLLTPLAFLLPTVLAFHWLWLAATAALEVSANAHTRSTLSTDTPHPTQKRTCIYTSIIQTYSYKCIYAVYLRRPCACTRPSLGDATPRVCRPFRSVKSEIPADQIRTIANTSDKQVLQALLGLITPHTFAAALQLADRLVAPGAHPDGVSLACESPVPALRALGGDVGLILRTQPAPLWRSICIDASGGPGGGLGVGWGGEAARTAAFGRIPRWAGLGRGVAALRAGLLLRQSIPQPS